MAEAYHSIKAVAQRTGLSVHVIRIWEKRYGVVRPARTGTNRRRYSEDQIQRLILLRKAIHAGHSIGNLVGLPIRELQALVANQEAQSEQKGDKPIGESPDAASLSDCLAAIKSLDTRVFESLLNRCATTLGAQGLLQRLIAPLAQSIGDLWRTGSITAGHEHFASGVIRNFLGQAAKPFAAAIDSPVLVVATPTGQLHELGALLAGAAGANLGWNVTYLGASLPAAEIAGAARQSRARAVALSFVYPEDDSRMESELTRLRELLPPEVAVVAGGRACLAYRDALERLGALIVDDLTQLCATLDGLRQNQKKDKQ
jgi:MerR family transcriptional regulator, light-induced transcriptional regulator